MSVKLQVRAVFGVCATCLALLTMSSAPGAQRVTVKPLVDAEHLRLTEDSTGPERAGVAIMGDTSKPGTYVFRYRYGAGALNPPHFHNQDRYVTVIKGTWWTGTGTVVEPEDRRRLRIGPQPSS